MTQLAERLGFNLANPLAGNSKLPPHLFECAEPTDIQTESKHDDFALPIRELA